MKGNYFSILSHATSKDYFYYFSGRIILKTSPRHLKDFKSVYEVVFHRSSITLSLAFNLFSGSSKLSKFIFLKRAMGDAWRDKSLHHVFHEQRKAFTVNFGHDVILFIALLNNN